MQLTDTYSTITTHSKVQLSIIDSKPTRQQTIHERPLRLRILTLLLLHQYRQYLNRRLQLQRIRPLPALHTWYTHAWLIIIPSAP